MIIIFIIQMNIKLLDINREDLQIAELTKKSVPISTGKCTLLYLR